MTTRRGDGGPARVLARVSRGIEAVGRDVRYTLRTMRRDAAWSICAIVIVGLGVGASATVFSVVHALLLRPLPFAAAERLVWVANGRSENLSSQTVQVANFLELRQSASLEEVAAFSPFYGDGDIRMTSPGEPERLTAVPVTENFFALLGVPPHLGRSFTAEEARFGAPKTALLAYALWQRRFAADPGVIGRAIRLDDETVTVVGVLPASFHFAETFTPGRPADLFVPFPLGPETNRRGNTLAVIARLKPGVDLRAAQAEGTIIGERVEASRREGASTIRRNGFAPQMSALRQRVSGRFDAALLVLAAAVGVLMAIVCANLSHLLIARASARRKEMAVRIALGATRRVLMRQMLVESLTLASSGAALGLALALGATRLIARLPHTTIPLLPDVRIDARVLAFTILVAVVCGLAFGLWPALHGSGVSPQQAMQDGSRGSSAGRDSWMRRAMVVSEIALACVLLSGTGLLLRSFVHILGVDPGFDTANVIAVRVDPSRAAATAAELDAHFDAVVREAGRVSGVEAVGLTDALPFGENAGWRTWTASPGGPPVDGGPRRETLVRIIDSGYFAAMRIPLRAGRGFAASDAASNEPVIIINDTLARAFWPNTDPIGRMVHTSGVSRRVVGVVGEVSYFGLDRNSGSEMYMPLRSGDYGRVDLVVRSARPASQLLPDIRAALRRVDPHLPVADFRTMDSLVDRSVFARRAVVLVIGGFAGFGLILASLGLYAVIAYWVSQRTTEIGIRLALGASPREVQQRIVTQTLTLAAVGLAIGLPASWLAGRAIQGLLFGIVPSDAFTFASVFALLTSVAALASYVPARRASRIDPIAALRAN